MLFDLDETYKALSDGTRRKILTLLKERDLTAGEIAENFDISKPSISHHLNILKNANLVDTWRQGQQIYYALNATVFQEFMSDLLNIFKKEDKSNE